MADPRREARRLLLEEHAALQRANLLFSIPSALALAVVMAFLAPVASVVVGTAVFMAFTAGGLVATSSPPAFDADDDDAARRLTRRLAAVNTVAGFVWAGFLLILLLPGATGGELLLAGVIPAVVLINMVEAAPVRASFLGFHVPFTVVTALGFALMADGSARWLALLLAALGLHALSMANTLGANARGRAELQVSHARVIDDLRTANRELDQRSSHDALTGLLNRAALEARMLEIHTSRATEDDPAVIFVDLDGLKPINDEYGHHVGDGIIITVARRIEEVAPEDALCCRLGGDEFVVVLSGGERTAEQVADELIAAIGRPVASLDGIGVTASVGIASYGPDEPDPGAAIRRADAAMYRAKAQGGDTWEAIGEEGGDTADLSRA